MRRAGERLLFRREKPHGAKKIDTALDKAGPAGGIIKITKNDDEEDRGFPPAKRAGVW